MAAWGLGSHSCLIWEPPAVQSTSLTLHSVLPQSCRGQAGCLPRTTAPPAVGQSIYLPVHQCSHRAECSSWPAATNRGPRAGEAGKLCVRRPTGRCVSRGSARLCRQAAGQLGLARLASDQLQKHLQQAAAERRRTSGQAPGELGRHIPLAGRALLHIEPHFKVIASLDSASAAAALM